MRIALVAGTDMADAEELRELAAGLREAGLAVSEHELDAPAGAGVQATVPALTGALRSAWAQARPDAVHAFGREAGLAALAAARDAGLPVVTSFGALAVAERRHGPGPLPLEQARLERAVATASGAVIAASCEEAEDLARMGVSRRRLHVIPPGVDTSVFTPDGVAVPPTRRDGRAKPRIVTAAAMDDEQSATTARAMAAIPGAELVACPPGAPASEVAALLRSADVFVDVPGYSARGTAVLQAMACGVPVIASAGGAHADMIIDGTTGLLVPAGRPDLLAARIRHLLRHPLLRQACAVAATDRARCRYSRDRVTAETIAVYEALAQGESLAA
jgi:glycosyltransferase involved in cell wall biosynthesis